MSYCKDCMYCDVKGINKAEALNVKRWYCSNPDIIISPVSVFDLPFSSEHNEYCFELAQNCMKEKD